MSHLLIALLGVLTSSPQSEVIDLTRTGGSPGTGRTTGPASVCTKSPTGREPVYAIDLSLTGLDRREYQVGGRIVVEVRLTNSGRDSVQIPISPSRIAASESRSMIWNLVATNAAGQRQAFGATMTWGSIK